MGKTPNGLGLSDQDKSLVTGEPYSPRENTGTIIFEPVPSDGTGIIDPKIGDRYDFWQNVRKLNIGLQFPMPAEDRALKEMEGRATARRKDPETSFSQSTGETFCSVSPIKSLFNDSCAKLNDEMTEKRELEIITAVNGTMNEEIKYTEDVDIADYNKTAGQTALEKAGDCEDYAIAKYTALRHAGIPAERLYIASVDAKPDEIGGGHVVLLYNSPQNNNWFVLNNDGRSTPYSSGAEFAFMKAPYAMYNETGAWYNPGLMQYKDFISYVDQTGPAAFPMAQNLAP